MVGGTLTYTLSLHDVNNGAASDLHLLADLPANVELVSTRAPRGPGCTTTAGRVDCFLDTMSGTTPDATVSIVVRVTAAGPLTLKASTQSRLADLNPADNTVTVLASASPQLLRPVIGAAKIVPGLLPGYKVTVRFRVTRGDTGALLRSGKMTSALSLGGKVIKHAQAFSNGIARLSFTIPRNAKGKLLKVKLTIKTAGRAASTVATFRVR